MWLLSVLGALCVFLLWCYSTPSLLFSSNLFNFFSAEVVFEGALEGISFFCLTMLLCCGGIALFYCYHYFSGVSEGESLFPVMVWFLGVMALLVLSSNLVVSLIFWEYLGLVSFLLILFYSNSASVRASLITLFASRFGDVALFFAIMWFSSWVGLSSIVIVVLLLLVVLTKSACYPFISWLLEAMRAPTPVSSLVHSSTLVAAGIWFLLRYDYIFSFEGKSVIFFLSSLTIVISGVCAMFFDDLKKIVALSTCNNVSWCLVFFICGDLGLALLQLITHGVCKCYLFMSVGDLMSQSGGSQSSVGAYQGAYSGEYGILGQGVLILSLCGLPYLGVFFSKHCMFSGFFYSFGLGSCILLLVGFLLSCVYSVRFALLLLSRSCGIGLGYSSSFLFISLLCVLGTFVNYLGGGQLEEVFSMGFCFSGLLFFLQVFGCLMGVYVFYMGGGFSRLWSSVIWGGDCVVNMVYSGFLWFSEVSLVGVYRWEVYTLSLFPRLSFEGGLSFFSLNFMVLGLLFLGAFFCLLL